MRDTSLLEKVCLVHQILLTAIAADPGGLEQHGLNGKDATVLLKEIEEYAIII